jgi:hydrocephalus-inducing protein
VDTKTYSIDCVFDSTEFPFLHVGDSPNSLAPGQSADVDVEFFPDQPKHYKALVPFSVNGLYTVNVVYTGEASPMRLELVKPEQNSVHFGHVREGHKETREIRMVNKSKLPVTCVVDKQCLEDLAALGVTPADGWNGQTPVMFPPRQANGMSFTYKPSRRGPSFDEELKLLINGATMPISLTRLRGGSIGTEVRLATDTMSFGTVTLGSRVSKKLAMQNTGDFGVKFAFDAKAAGPEFSIKPSEGFVPANQDVQLEVWFHPTTQGADIRADKIKCQIGGKGAGSAEPLDLTLTGACVPQEAQEGVVEFKTTARLTTEGSVSVTNSGTQTWNLKPTVTGDQWSGPEFFEAKPGATAEYTLTYKPLSMATEEEPHTGSVLFALPDGSCLLHSLKGVADEPDSMGAVEAEVPARQPGSVRVKVANWLNKRQRFKVSVEIEGADPEKPDPTVSLKGPDYFDCPASAEREYKLGFFAHKEGQTKAKVTFTNEDTKEFAHYDVTVTATAADVQGTLRLHGACRQKASAKVKVVNPLPEPVVFTAKCDHACVTVPETLEVPANGSAQCEISYRPTIVEPETELPFVLSSAELGNITHNVKLSSAPAPPERGVSFVVPLGQKETKAFKFTHYDEPESQMEYTCEFQNGGTDGQFACAPTHVAHGAGDDGMEQNLEIAFEPTKIGSHYRDVLVVKSESGHEYVCPVTAKCVPPKPRGPFKLSGSGGSVPFKNVFDAETEFTMTTDNPWFVVDRVAVVGAKTESQVAVKYGAPEGWEEGKDAPTTGKLLVTCKGSPAPWVYYLKATP